MIDNNQAQRLKRMMSKHMTVYDVVLSSVKVLKKRYLKMLAGDIFILNIDKLDLLLVHKKNIVAKVDLKEKNDIYNVEVEKLLDEKVVVEKDKNHVEVRFVFGTVESSDISKGGKYDMKSMSNGAIDVVVDENVVAEAMLVSVDNKFAIEIKKVL